MKRGPIVATIPTVLILSLAFVSRCRTPQGGLVGTLIIHNLPAILDAGQSRFHVSELRSGDHVLRASRKDAANLFLRFADSIGSLRMRRKRLGKRPGFLLLTSLQLLEELHERIRIVSRLVHVLQAKVVGFRLKAAREAQKCQRQSQACRRTNGITDAASYEDQRNGSNVRPLSARHLTRRVTGSNMGDLVRHNTGKFGLFVSSQDQSRVYVEESAGQGESIDFVRVDNLDGERDLGIGVADQVLTDAI